MILTLATDLEIGGRWVCEIPELPGCVAHGVTEDQSIRRAQALALRVVADGLESGKPPVLTSRETLTANRIVFINRY